MSAHPEEATLQAEPMSVCEGIRFLDHAGGEFTEAAESPLAISDCLRQVAEEGLADRTLVENLFVCERCASTALRIIERCRHCRSIDIEPEALIHHCACAAVFRDRAADGKTVATCVKCGRARSDSPEEFEAAGFISCCGACGTANAEPAVSLVCSRCGKETDGQRASKRRFHRYRLNAAGRARLGEGTP